MTFPGWPCNDFDFHFAEAGAALAGLIIRDTSGVPVSGVLPSAEVLLTAGAGWTINVAPFVAARAKGRAVLLGGSADPLVVGVAPAPAANARLDVVYSLPAEVGSGDPIEAVNVVTGVAGAVPVKPSIPDGAIELGTYRSQAGQSSAAQGVITNTFRFTAASGGTIIVRAASDLNALNLVNGSHAFDLATSRDYTRIKGSWKRDPIIWATTGTAPGPVAPAAQNSVAVPFPVGMFPAAPVVTVTPYTVVPGSASVGMGVSGVSASGATVYLGRNNNVATPFGLTAVLP